jgi:hypothetical protein
VLGNGAAAVAEDEDIAGGDLGERDLDEVAAGSSARGANFSSGAGSMGREVVRW